jgi:hypothetical protein
MSMALSRTLAFAGIPPERAYMLGQYSVYELSDIKYIDEYFLISMGFSFAESKELIRVADTIEAVGGIDMYDAMFSASMKSEYAAVHELTSFQPRSAYSKTCIHSATSLLLSSYNSRNAALAMDCMIRAKASTSNTADRQLIESAIRAIRDVLSWRIQNSVTWGDREAYVDALTIALGTKPDNNTFSLLMLSFAKITEQFPSTFLSKNKQDRIKKGAEPRKKKGDKKVLVTIQEDDDDNDIPSQLPTIIEETADDLNKFEVTVTVLDFEEYQPIPFAAIPLTPKVKTIVGNVIIGDYHNRVRLDLSSDLRILFLMLTFHGT